MVGNWSIQNFTLCVFSYPHYTVTEKLIQLEYNNVILVNYGSNY